MVFRLLLTRRLNLYKKSAKAMSRLADIFYLAICGIMNGAGYSGKEDLNVKSFIC